MTLERNGDGRESGCWRERERVIGREVEREFAHGAFN